MRVPRGTEDRLFERLLGTPTGGRVVANSEPPYNPVQIINGCFRDPKTSFPLHLHRSIQSKIERSTLSSKKFIGPWIWEKHRTNRRLSKTNRREHVGKKTPCRKGEERQHESTRTYCWRLMKRVRFAGVCVKGTWSWFITFRVKGTVSHGIANLNNIFGRDQRA